MIHHLNCLFSGHLINELRFSDSVSLFFKTWLTLVTCFCGDVTYYIVNFKHGTTDGNIITLFNVNIIMYNVNVMSCNLFQEMNFDVYMRKVKPVLTPGSYIFKFILIVFIEGHPSVVVFNSDQRF